MFVILSYVRTMERDERLAAVASALEEELFFRRHGVASAFRVAGEEACALAQVALLAVKGDDAALVARRRARAATLERLFAPDAALAVAHDLP